MTNEKKGGGGGFCGFLLLPQNGRTPAKPQPDHRKGSRCRPRDLEGVERAARSLDETRVPGGGGGLVGLVGRKRLSSGLLNGGEDRGSIGAGTGRSWMMVGTGTGVLNGTGTVVLIAVALALPLAVGLGAAALALALALAVGLGGAAADFLVLVAVAFFLTGFAAGFFLIAGVVVFAEAAFFFFFAAGFLGAGVYLGGGT